MKNLKTIMLTCVAIPNENINIEMITMKKIKSFNFIALSILIINQ